MPAASSAAAAIVHLRIVSLQKKKARANPGLEVCLRRLASAAAQLRLPKICSRYMNIAMKEM